MTPRKLSSLLVFLLTFLSWNVAAAVKLVAPRGYLPGKPLPVRVEILNEAGLADRNAWNEEAVLSVDHPAVKLSTNIVAVRNGVGTVLVTIDGVINFNLRATVGNDSATRALRNRAGETVTQVGGTLTGTNNTWSGVVNVTNHVTIPAGQILTIAADAFVLVDGVASGTGGVVITADGAIESLGSEELPVTITCSDASLNWGQIRHAGAVRSVYRHTMISKAGRVTGEGHTGTGPAFRMNNSSLVMEDCVLSDLNFGAENIGKVMMATGSMLEIRDSIFSRARMGPEIATTGLICEDSYFLEMRGPDDADGIYLHESGGRPLVLSSCVLAGGDDDAVDTLGSRVTMENCILRDWTNPAEDAKGVSAFEGEVILRDSVIVNCFEGVVTKSDGSLGVVRIDQCTITGIQTGVSAESKANANAGNLQIFIANSIVRSADALHSDFGADRFVSVTYCDLSESWPGVGNITADPMFVDPAAGDFRLSPESRCIDAADPAAALDRDFSRADIGAYSAAGELPVSAPVVVSVSPVTGETISTLSTITVTFSAPVAGVNGGDLLMNGVPATGVIGSGAGPYRFTFAQPTSDAVQAKWAAEHNIHDARTNRFAGGAWRYVFDPTASAVVINEIMYHPASENPLEEYIELHNRGAFAVNLNGWRIRDGVEFTFPNVSIPGGGFLVVVANRAAFALQYPGVMNVVGDWAGRLSNNGEEIEIEDANGNLVDRVIYSDEGDWGARRRGVPHWGYRGWEWHAEHDGLGSSAELIKVSVSNDQGQNWRSSLVGQGTPGRQNSVTANRIAPLIGSVAHFPAVPKSTESVVVSANVTGSASPNPRVVLKYRLDVRPGASTGTNFVELPMADEGGNGDGIAGDGIFSARVPAQTNGAIVEFFIEASDALELKRNWPAPAIAAADGSSIGGQVANALYQVDDTPISGAQPLYKVIMTGLERSTLEAIGNGTGANSDAEMNATFISLDGTGTEVRYLIGVRNRGHGSRSAEPNNFRVNFRSDERWKGVLALNLNAQYSWLQVLGAALHMQAGSAGAYSRAVQLRVNNANLALNGGLGRTFGSYAANEVIDADWVERHFPNDNDGNVYRAIRDLFPPTFDYRVTNVYLTVPGPEDKNSYTNTWFKSTNESEDDWSDLIGMLRVIGLNGIEPFTAENVERVIDVDQWLLHLAVMNLLGNSETGLNTGHNDDYFMFRGLRDERFKLVYYDLDQILGFNGGYPWNAQLFSCTNANGAGQAIGRMLREPTYQQRYLETLRRLVHTTFSTEQFDALVEQTLGEFVPEALRAQLKNYMKARREFVLSQLPVVPAAIRPNAVITGMPRSPTPKRGATLRVSGEGVTQYRYSLNDGPFSAEAPVESPIVLSNLSDGTVNLRVIGRNAAGVYQTESTATEADWIVIESWPAVRLSEVLASRSGGLPDQVELYNEGSAAVSLDGLSLTDDLGNPHRYRFGATVLNAGAYLALDANTLGFSLSVSGEGLYLQDASTGLVLDRVEFGQQLSDLSIGRVGESGEWQLTNPTFGAANSLAALGDLRAVRINEWHTAGVSPYPDDFIELYNPGALPVAVGGMYLTDERVGAPERSRIAPLTFLAAGGYLPLTAGEGASAGEISFRLPAEQGQIAFLDRTGTVVDSVVYGPQQLGFSSGRCPDGSARQKRLETPTPGAPNDCPLEPPAPERIVIVPMNHAWKYNAVGGDLGTAWKETSFDDPAWPQGPGPLGFDPDPLPEPLRTIVPSSEAVTYYFRTSFQVDPTLRPSSLEIVHLIDDGAAFYLNGQEIGTRFNLFFGATANTPAVSAVNNASPRSFPIPGDLLQPGTNRLAVEVHQVSGNVNDMVMGLQMTAIVVTNSPGEAGVVINELLADNESLQEVDGSSRDWVELYNPSDATVDLGGMSLTDAAADSARWVFPAGTLLGAKSFLRVLCSEELPASATNTGFGLSAEGGALFLYAGAAQGGALQSAITYGLQAPDWSVGRVPDGSTNWVLNLPTPSMANTAASLGNPGALKVNEWMADPAAGGDWFEIFNPNPEPAEVSGLLLSDDLTERDKHVLPELSFIGNAARAFRRFEADEVLSGANHVSFRLGAAGDSVVFSFPDGTVIDAVAFGQQNRGVSQGRLLDGGTNVVSFPGSSSPGAANFVPLDSIVVNEVLTHSDAPLMDAVEFYNTSAIPVAIGGWFISDSAVNLRKYQVPAGTVIGGSSYAVFYEDDFNGDSAGESFSFSSAAGDEVYLSEAVNGELTGRRAAVSFGPAENGVSFGRVQTSVGFDFVPMERRTFGRDNPASTAEFKLGVGASNAPPKIGPIVISEIHYHPLGTNEALEFIEIANLSAATVTLQDAQHPTNTWRLRKGVEMEFPTGTSIPPFGSMVLVGFDPVNDSATRAQFEEVYGTTAPLMGPYRGRLSNSGDVIELQKPDVPQPDGSVPYVCVDRVAYSDAAPWPAAADGLGNSLQKLAFQLFGNDPLHWQAAAPMPGPSSTEDYDGDQIPDYWERFYGLNPGDGSDAQEDNDRDGSSNLHEYVAGTDPTSEVDALRLSAEHIGTEMMLGFRAAPGRSYALFYSDESPIGPWQQLELISPSADSIVVHVTDPGPRGPQRFYRLQVQVDPR